MLVKCLGYEMWLVAAEDDSHQLSVADAIIWQPLNFGYFVYQEWKENWTEKGFY